MHYLIRTLLVAILAIASGKAVWGEELPKRKLDKALQTYIADGCSGGPKRVIISVKSGYRKGMGDSLKAHGDKVKAELKSIDAVAAEVHCDDLEALAAMAETTAVSIDGDVETHAATRNSKKSTTPTQAEVAAQLKAPMFQSMLAWPQLRAASYLGSPYSSTDNSMINTVNSLLDAGMTGTAGGIGIALIDSGITPGPEFENRIAGFYDFTKGDIQAVTAIDPYGHGTHVGGLIGGVNVGVAPGARIVALRVLDDNGKGSTSDVVRALEFAVANKAALNLHVINLSLGHPIYESAASDPLVQAVENAVRHGFIVSVSAGNFGVNKKTGEPGYAGIASPGNAPSAITSGSTNMFDTISRLDDRVSAFSSRGPTWYDGFMKPDLVAPGENVLSVAAVGSRLRMMQELRGNTGEYMRLSGTSMAAGVTTGIIALTIDLNPKLTSNALKAILEYSAIPVLTSTGTAADALTQGAGQINGGGAAMLAWVITADAPVGSKWLIPGYETITPTTEIGDRKYTWSQSILWGARKLSGANLMTEQRPAWGSNIVWGEGLGSEDDNIVWGNNFGDDDNIVWGNALDTDDNIVWGSNIVWGNDDDNIVWGSLSGEDDNIVWGNNIVWGSNLVGMSLDDDNIVWGSASDDDNIVWGNLDDDNIVWGNLDDDNIVWGNLYDDNIVWGSNDDDNIVWGYSLLTASSKKGGRK
jgi:serine protease AprX